MAGNRRFSQRRLDIWRSLVRAIVRTDARSRDKPVPRLTVGQVDALVFKLDFDSYAHNGHSLTGATWHKGKHYPYPCTANGERR
jgi:lysozyme family protein